MNHLITEANLGDRIVCDSAGTSGYHIGEPPDGRMTAAARQAGIRLSGRSRQFELADFENFDLILAMDKDNYRSLLRLDRQDRYTEKVSLMCSHCQTFSDDEVPDPYYGGDAGFRYVIDLLRDACGGLLVNLENNYL